MYLRDRRATLPARSRPAACANIAFSHPGQRRVTGERHPTGRGRLSPALNIFRDGDMMAAMARAATTSDAFNAIAEPQRRDILALLRAGERPVTDLAQALGMSQPRASKHLRVLREVGL